MQWFLSESGWDHEEVNGRRLELLLEDSATAPNWEGVLIIDEHGDRKWGKHTAHVGKQWLAYIGKTENGVVGFVVCGRARGCTILWRSNHTRLTTTSRVAGPIRAFRTKLRIAQRTPGTLGGRAVPFRAVVADSFYGEDEGLKAELERLGAGYVMALKESHSWWHREGRSALCGRPPKRAGWKYAEQPGRWEKVTRAFRDGHREEWWALEVEAGPYGPENAQRAFVVTTDPERLPRLLTWYLTTNLPAPGDRLARETEGQALLAAASVAEVVYPDPPPKRRPEASLDRRL